METDLALLLRAMASTLIEMASYLRVMASNLLAMSSNAFTELDWGHTLRPDLLKAPNQHSL